MLFAQYGFEVLNSESKSFGVTPQRHSHTTCLDEVRNSDYLILIIGGRRGGTYIRSDKSITNEEFALAKKLGLPIIACVDKKVFTALQLYKRNPMADYSAFVEDKRVFQFIEFVASDSEDNWLHQYDTVSDIEDIIKTQLAHFLFLYSHGLKDIVTGTSGKESPQISFIDFPRYLNRVDADKSLAEEERVALKNGLRKLHQLMKDILASKTKTDTKYEKFKVFWVMKRYGRLESDHFTMEMDTFKQYAWSSSRNRRVSNQFKPFRVDLEEVVDSYDGTTEVSLRFMDESSDCNMAFALDYYVDALVNANQEDNALELFNKIDMRLFQ